MAASAADRTSCVTTFVQAVLLGEAHRAHLDAEPLIHAVTLTEGELRATAAGVEDDPRPLRTEARRRRGVREPSLVLTGNDLDGDTTARLDGGR